MVFQRLRKKYEEWQERRFLRKHHCETREQYNRRYDPKVCFHAPTVGGFYHGYPYIHVFRDHRQDLVYLGDWFQNMGLVREWAEEHCQGAFRYDLHRMSHEQEHLQDWRFDDCFGQGDYCFFAFEKEEDYIWFRLKWA